MSQKLCARPKKGMKIQENQARPDREQGKKKIHPRLKTRSNQRVRGRGISQERVQRHRRGSSNNEGLSAVAAIEEGLPCGVAIKGVNFLEAVANVRGKNNGRFLSGKEGGRVAGQRYTSRVVCFSTSGKRASFKKKKTRNTHAKKLRLEGGGSF